MKKLLFLIIIASTLYSQQIFTVLYSNNTVYKKNNSWVQLTIGQKLISTDIIKSNNKGYADLLYKNGKVIKFNSIKETLINTLESTLNKQGITITGQVTAAINSIDRKVDNSSKFTSASAGATRAVDMNKELFIITPRTCTNILDTLLISWNRVKDENLYQVSILTEELLPITSVLVLDTFYYYRKVDKPLEKGKTYICMIKLSKSKKQEFQLFHIASDSERVKMQYQLKQTEIFTKDVSNISKIMLHGVTCEDLNLYTEAYLDYRKLIELVPKEQMYKKMLADLLYKVNLTKQVKYLSGCE